MGLLDTAVRVAKAGFNEAVKPENHVIGDKFESYVLKMFPEADWILEKRTQNYTANQERYEEKSKEPDFLFRHKTSGRRINVECKFRSHLVDEKIQWCEDYQFKRYMAIDAKWHNVYIVIGFRGLPDNPHKIYRIPMSEIRYTGLFPLAFKQYEVPYNHRFELVEGKLV